MTLVAWGLVQVTPTKSFFQINFNLYRIIYTTASIVVLPVTFYVNFCENFSCLHTMLLTKFEFRKRTALFWVVSQRVVVFSYRRFRIKLSATCSRFRFLNPDDGTDRLFRNVVSDICKFGPSLHLGYEWVWTVFSRLYVLFLTGQWMKNLEQNPVNSCRFLITLLLAQETQDLATISTVKL